MSQDAMDTTPQLSGTFFRWAVVGPTEAVSLPLQTEHTLGMH